MVKYSPHARAIRDVEDDDLRSFFYGMSPWQVYISIEQLAYVLSILLYLSVPSFFLFFFGVSSSSLM